jgi:hypothetical protein
VRGWRSVEELTHWGFARAPVVMANEAHDGLARCVRTRAVGIRMIRAAHDARVRHLALEALPAPAAGAIAPVPVIPPRRSGYLAQPDLRALITAALELGWTLWPYEAAFESPAPTGPGRLTSMEFTNWREREQARNLGRVLAATGGERLLVWSGNGHAARAAVGDWVPMGAHFAAQPDTSAFIVDQNVTVEFGGRAQPWVAELLAGLADVLAAHGGTAGILSEHAPDVLRDGAATDAVIISTDNALT